MNQSVERSGKKTSSALPSVPERLEALRARMREEGVDACLVPTDDFHGSEYVGEYFKCREFITGFTGSAGTALILNDSAGLWTDGRYFLQAARQLDGSGVALFKMFEENVPTLEEYLTEKLTAGMTLGLDGRTVSARSADRMEALLAGKGARLRCDLDLVGDIWPERPAMSARPAWLLAEKWAGESASGKISRVREALREKGADSLLLTSLDDIAWLLNIRGDDVACNPVVLSYVYLAADEVRLYANPAAFAGKTAGELEGLGVRLFPYEQVYADMKELPAGTSLMLDPDRVNAALRRLVPEKVRVIEDKNPTQMMKAVKNPTESAHMVNAHIKDGAAVTRFIYWLKTRTGREEITELSAAEKLEELRREQEDYLGPSFTPIIAYREHAAIMHYSATPESSVRLLPEGMLLADTGGQYLDGTTDITRTIVLGKISREEKEFFTRVLRGNLNLGAACFPYGAGGRTLDYPAREPLWEIGEDYNHGTGHGVGFVLNVHEGPVSINYRIRKGPWPDTVLEEGMVMSNEPGFYLPGRFGIRHENMMICKEDRKRPGGRFMRFETLTMVPFDLDGIIPEMMTEREKALLNAYHAKVRETISPLLPSEERDWLEEAARTI